MLLIAVVDQRVQTIDTFQHHGTATTAIATVGSAILYERLTPETDTAGATVATFQKHLGLIEELHLISSGKNLARLRDRPDTKKGTANAPFPHP